MDWQLLLWIVLIFLPLALAATEKEILLQFKQAIVDSTGELEKWDAATNPDVCRWKGVQCDGDGAAVVGINFDHFQLSGTVSPIICELPHLTSFVVAYNHFEQAFPSWFEQCSELVHLNLTNNSFHGQLPQNISMLGRLPLRTLDLSFNAFTGAMPDALGELPATLEVLSLRENHFTHLTPSISRLSNLTLLDVAYNAAMLPASIPPEFGRLTKLVHLQLSGCNFVGSIPPELGNLKELDALEFSNNNLTGSIPVELMYLPKLTMLELWANNLSGQIPREIGNLARLTDLDASQNALNGSIPAEIGELKNLRLLHLYINKLSGSIPASLAELPKLELFTAYANDLSGEIPQSLGKNSGLSYVSLSRNRLTGTVPPDFCAGGALQNLTLYENKLSGPIPESFGDCTSLLRLRLQENNLEGPVPRKLWASPNISLLDLSFNRLNGTVASGVKGAVGLEILVLDGNKFEGALSDELGDLPHLVKLSAAGNLISSFHFGTCSSLENFDLSHNLLSGTIPADISNCMRLTTVDLSANNLSGQIPSSLHDVSRLSLLDLSANHLSGQVPPGLENLPLTDLNVSNNDLEGAIPATWRRNFPAESFAGNPRLCSNSSSCSNGSIGRRSSDGTTQLSVVWILVIVGAVVLLLGGTFCVCWFNFKPAPSEPPQPQWRVKSFQRLPFNELAVVDKLDENNVIGSGGSGKVYRVDLASGHSIAVKQILRSALEDDYHFQGEVSALGQIRHRNIVKLLSCCWNATTDLLVFEYIPNGTLRDALHGKKVADLDWNSRYRIALGTAHGLSYLHHNCDPPILHRDVKSANILLDADYEPKLADFGLARLLETQDEQTMTNFAGSYGYIAPEYTYTLKVNTRSDTYSFGVVLLELVTGKRPVAAEYGDADIVSWVKGRCYAKGPQVVLDPRLGVSAQDQMTMLLDVALLCTKQSPEERPTMRQVVEKLRAIYPDKCYFPSTEEFSPASASESTSSCSSPGA